ncbi:MAG: tyrosine-type recombinase/integrase [Candidatus Thorarchaeota archaeon]
MLFRGSNLYLAHVYGGVSELADEHDLGLLKSNSNGKQLVTRFLRSRREGLSPHTISFYRRCITPLVSNYPLTPEGINEFLHSLCCGNGKFAYYRAIRAFCNWLQRQNHIRDNPIRLVDRPNVSQRLLPSISEEQMEVILESADCLRDKCIVSLLFDSGLRLSEICSIKPEDIDWSNNTVRVVVKGNREAKAAFTPKTVRLLKEHLTLHSNNSLFDMKPRGVQDMLARLSEKVGTPCNAHAFRRGFACQLHKKGLSTLSIMFLGRWSSLDMVTRYTRSLSFDDCLSHYREVNG